VQECGYLYVPLQGPKLNAAKLLKHLGRMPWAFGGKRTLWLVDRELFYPEIGPVLGCSANSAAILYAGLQPEELIREALHEVGHLLGPVNCKHACVMSLSNSPENALYKSYFLCQRCSTELLSGVRQREGLKAPSLLSPHLSGPEAGKLLDRPR
jgi:predicted Zn-dependent protease